MAGTVRGVVNQRHYSDSDTAVVNVFVNFWRAFQLGVASGQIEVIASNYGDGGTGFDAPGGANPPGPNAWFVVRMPPSANRASSLYILVQYTDSSAAFGAAPGNPGLVQSSTTQNRVGIAVASGRDSADADASPWQGTTNADGADVKADPVWAAPGGGELYVFPRSNAAGGSDAASAENTQQVYLGSSGSVEGDYHCVYDDDSFSCFGEDDETTLDVFMHAGPMVLEPGLDVNFDIIALGNTSVLLTNSSFGDLTGSGSDQSAVQRPIGRETIFAVLGDEEQPATDYTFEPDDAAMRAADNGAAWFTERPIEVYAGETSTGLIGQIHPDGMCMIKLWGMRRVTEREDGSQRRSAGIASNTSTTAIRVTFPWGPSGSNPINSATAAGVEVGA